MQSDIPNKKTLDGADLAQFTGTQQWYRHLINQTVLYTDGAQYVAEHVGAYWLLDEIALIQPYDKKVGAGGFQVWTMTVRSDKRATLTCGDGNGNAVFGKDIDYTDFPLDAITFYFTKNILLPSEYCARRGPGSTRGLLNLFAANVVKSAFTPTAFHS